MIITKPGNPRVPPPPPWVGLQLACRWCGCQFTLESKDAVRPTTQLDRYDVDCPQIGCTSVVRFEVTINITTPA